MWACTMNDFTKEELQSVWRWADSHSEFEWYKKLATKIKSMIDNYCEHESDDLIYTIISPQNKCI